MKLKDLIRLLEKHHKWVCKKEEGFYVCLMNSDEIQIQLIPKIVKCADHFRVGLAPAVSFNAFSEAAKFISDDNHSFTPVCVNWRLGEKIIELTPAEILRLSENAISWALSQDLEEGLTNYRNLPSSPGEIPVRHLAALALAGDVTRLGYYKQCFGRGDRLGFGLSVSVEMVERSISIAQKVNHQKDKVQILRDGSPDLLYRCVSPVERIQAKTGDELPFVGGHACLVMNYRTEYWPLRM